MSTYDSMQAVIVKLKIFPVPYTKNKFLNLTLFLYEIE